MLGQRWGSRRTRQRTEIFPLWCHWSRWSGWWCWSCPAGCQSRGWSQWRTRRWTPVQWCRREKCQKIQTRHWNKKINGQEWLSLLHQPPYWATSDLHKLDSYNREINFKKEGKCSDNGRCECLKHFYLLQDKRKWRHREKYLLTLRLQCLVSPLGHCCTPCGAAAHIAWQNNWRPGTGLAVVGSSWKYYHFFMIYWKGSQLWEFAAHILQVHRSKHS